MSGFHQVTVKELAELCQQQSVDVIDVRTPAEFRQLHATIARNVPLDSLDPEAVMTARNGTAREGTADQPLYVICKSGGRSKMACEKLCRAGYTNIINVEGGTSAWAAANLPVVRGKKTMSLERQVRIAAGTLTLVGSMLGYFVHPAFIGIPAFVGAGLMHSGVTDSCAMGMIIAKMPWNQVKGSEQDGQTCAT